MAGLGPAIHVLATRKKNVDARDKPGHDNVGTFAHFTASNSTSNIKVAFGGITPPAPRAP
ncbi:hypothetical protein ABIF90_007912 [Bradyrhizobium japonicum]